MLSGDDHNGAYELEREEARLRATRAQVEKCISSGEQLSWGTCAAALARNRTSDWRECSGKEENRGVWQGSGSV